MHEKCDRLVSAGQPLPMGIAPYLGLNITAVDHLDMI